MDEFDLLAASLGSVKDFTINDKVLNVKLKNIISKYYDNRYRDDELLIQFKVKSDEEFEWSAFDFLLAFQEHLAVEYNVLNKLDFNQSIKDIRNIPFIFKLYNISNCNMEGLKIQYFNSNNINTFINKCTKGVELLKCIINDMYPQMFDKETKISKTARN